MALRRFEIKADVPDGYRAVRYGMPVVGDTVLLHDGGVYGPIISDEGWSSRYLVIEKLEPSHVQLARLCLNWNGIETAEQASQMHSLAYTVIKEWEENSKK